MKKIELTQGKFALIDDEDFEKVDVYNWFAAYMHGKWYARNRKLGYLHRFLLETDSDIDHVDGDGLNCQRHNMRPATHGQNQVNKATWSTSGFKGVCQRGDRYRAQIKSNKKKISLGTYDTPEEAAHAYDNAAHELHGAFAVLNFPEEKQHSN
jgi:hypothetical protein